MGQKDDNSELNSILKGSGKGSDEEFEVRIKPKKKSKGEQGQVALPDDEVPSQQFSQWTSSDNKLFIPSTKSIGRLAPALYEIKASPNIGIYFEKVKMSNEGLIKFPDSNSDKIITEIKKFWEREELFHKHRIAFKRGILLWGPPGSGKTCTIKLLVEDLIKNREGIVLKFTDPSLFATGVRILRAIQPTTPIIVLMEDLDSILNDHSESEVINILDGVDMVEKVAFLATTNYPERLGPRIVNRPSRFDKRLKIGMPSPEARKLYLEHLTKGCGIDINKWVKDTQGFSVAHLKELFVSVYILGDEYPEALETLKSMKDSITSTHDGDKVGL